MADENAYTDESKGQRSSGEYRLAERDGFLIARVGDHCLELDQPRIEVVGPADGPGQKELDRLARPSRDVLQGGERRSRTAGFNQVDRGRRHVALAKLGEAQARLQAGLLDRAWAKVDAGEPAALRSRNCRNWCVSTPAAHDSSLYPQTFNEVFTAF